MKNKDAEDILSSDYEKYHKNHFSSLFESTDDIIETQYQKFKVNEQLNDESLQLALEGIDNQNTSVGKFF